jgi:hypothetical protein
MESRSQETQTDIIRTIRESPTVSVPYKPLLEENKNGVFFVRYEIIVHGKYREVLLIGYGEYPDSASKTHHS